MGLDEEHCAGATTAGLSRKFKCAERRWVGLQLFCCFDDDLRHVGLRKM